ncbi:hypothetical protein P3X46_011970 [Hevea brasiliensis]|uniref:Sieve element occlusion N-terminal domain-containing protein n=1 Tax=Hevea brasiliensis TaxID=3981 RepID=A0ABQ9M8T3_HEVBR|nr:hypothetical protein P3X46_011970 [Hevea brasiliensis]
MSNTEKVVEQVREKLPINHSQQVPLAVQPSQQPPIPTGDSWNFFHSDDSATIKKVEQTHKPDGSKVDFNYISCNRSSRGAHETTIMLLESLLPNYSWDAKLAIAVAAFAMNYGELYPLVQLYTSNPVAKNIITELIEGIMDVMKCVVQFNELSPDIFAKPSVSTAKIDIARAVYWTIYSVVTCGSHIAALVGLTPEMTIATMGRELSELAGKIRSMHTLLQQQLNHCKEELDAYTWLEIIFKRPRRRDNLEILEALFFHVEGDKQIPPLVVGNTKAEVCLTFLLQKLRVEITQLKDMNLLLVISGSDERAEEIRALAKLFEDLQKKGKFQYQVLWLPVVDKLNEQKFSLLQSLMPWYTVQQPSIIKPGALRYFREVWQFKNQTILVRLDSSGSVPSPFPLDYLWLWGELPGTSEPPSLDDITLDIIIHDLYTVDSAKPKSIICFWGVEDIK